MSDIAELGLKLNADGMVVGVSRVRKELATLGAEGSKVQTRVQVFAKESAFALSSLASSGTRDLTTVAKSLSNVGFAFGVQVGVITLALSAIADAFAEEWKKVREENEKFLQDFLSFEKRLSESALRIRIAALEARRDQLVDDSKITPHERFLRGDGAMAAFGAQFREAFGLAGPELAAIRALEDRLAAARLRMTELGRERVGKQIADDLKKAATASRDLVSGLNQYAEALARANHERDTFAGLTKGFAAPSSAPEGFLSPEFLDDLGRALDVSTEKLKKILDALKDITKERERQKQALQGLVVGGAAGLLDRAMPGVGGVLQSGISGFGAAGPWGAAAGAGFSLVDMLFDMADAGKRADEQFRQFTKSIDDFIDSEKEALGIVSGLQARLNQVNRAYADQREALEVQMKLLAAQNEMTGYDRERAQRWGQLNQQLQELNALEGERTAQLQRQQGEIERLMSLDNEVLRLRLLGHDEEAEALSRQIDHQREMNALIDSGGSTREQQLLSERHALEDLLAKADKIKERIASLTGTIEGLQAFRNRLQISPDSGLSPTDRLATARQQYEDVLARTQGIDTNRRDMLLDRARMMEQFAVGPNRDRVLAEIEELRKAAMESTMSVEQRQAAADSLPAAAQALLELSRLVFGSGEGFQSDLAKVLADSQAVINSMTDLRTIEEEMLEQLRMIAASTEEVADIERNRPNDRRGFDGQGGNGGSGGSGGGTGGGGSETAPGMVIAASQQIANAVAVEVRKVALRLESLEATFKREIRGGSLN